MPRERTQGWAWSCPKQTPCASAALCPARRRSPRGLQHCGMGPPAQGRTAQGYLQAPQDQRHLEGHHCLLLPHHEEHGRVLQLGQHIHRHPDALGLRAKQGGGWPGSRPPGQLPARPKLQNTFRQSPCLAPGLPGGRGAGGERGRARFAPPVTFQVPPVPGTALKSPRDRARPAPQPP